MSLRMGKPAWTRTRAVLSLGMVFGLGAAGTMAAWSSSATATTGVFSVKSVIVELNGSRASSQFTGFNVSGLTPGEGKAAMLAVKNTGSAAFDYTSNVVTTGQAILANALTLNVFRGGSVSGASCINGTPLTSFPLAPGAPQDATGAATRLNPTETDDLCVQVTLADPVTKAASNMYVTTKFIFTAVES